MSRNKARVTQGSSVDEDDLQPVVTKWPQKYFGIIKWILLALAISLLSVSILELFQSTFKVSKTVLDGTASNSEHERTRLSKIGQNLKPELINWLKEYELDSLMPLFLEYGIVSLVSVVQLDAIAKEDQVDWSQSKEEGDTTENTESKSSEVDLDPSSLSSLVKRIPVQDRERLKRAAIILRQRLILRLWLDDNGLLEYASRLNTVGVNSIEDAYWFEDLRRLEEVIGEKVVPMWTVARQSLPTGIGPLERLKLALWNRIVSLDHQSIWNTWGTMLLVTLSVSGFGAMVSYFPQVLDAKKAIFQYVSGKFSIAANCQVEFDWEDPIPVGQTLTIKVRFFQRGGRPYPICDKDNILVEIRKDSQKIAVVTEFGSSCTTQSPSSSPDGPIKTENEDVNLLRIRFSVRKAGQYSINVLAENEHVQGSPFLRTFLPQKIEASKTIFMKQTSTIVCVTGSSHKLMIEPRDTYGNKCRTRDYHLDAFSFVATKIGHENENEKNCLIQFSHDNMAPSSGGGGSGGCNLSSLPLVSPNKGMEAGRVALTVRFPEGGVYHGRLTYEKEGIGNGSFDILALTPPEAAAVQKNVALKSPSGFYEGRLLSLGSEVQNKSRKVYITVSSKQLVVKEYFLKLLPIRVATFRVSPNTKIQFNGGGGNNETDLASVLTIDDGAQPAVRVALKDAKIVVATFTHFLLRNIGGSETFQDKQEYFFKELREYHRKHTRDKVTLKLSRDNIIESTWKATKSLSANDWCRNFDISFAGEQGIDWGGLRREWFEKVSSKLFEAGNPVGMFDAFSESHLVHPNPNSRWKCKHYEMAGKIVGKCLYESSLGAAYRQLVKAKFTRSFLAQLIGLRVNYKYFEHDDPELHLRKVKFILENDVEGMDLTFVEEEYELGKLVKTVDLIPDGSRIKVTNENKKNYLNALAQYRLCTKIKPEIEAFIKGLNLIVPDDLLTIFDENELELLICGQSEYSVTDLREHHIICGSSEGYRKILDWFWSIVGNMTEEEKGRLLQFTTGSSLLPNGGFKELSPLFQIIFSPTSGTLPTAHTCFNQLCLPDYDSYEAFERSLRIAINEGSEGFGLI